MSANDADTLPDLSCRTKRQRSRDIWRRMEDTSCSQADGGFALRVRDPQGEIRPITVEDFMAPGPNHRQAGACRYHLNLDGMLRKTHT